MIYNYLNFLSIENIDQLKNWENGYNPFKSSYIKLADSKDPEWHISSIQLSNNPIGSINSNGANASAGTSIYFEEALVRSTGEAIERYCALNHCYIDRPHLMKVDNGKKFVRCADIENAPKSFKLNGLTQEIEHSEVIRLVDGKVDYLPFETVHLGFKRSSAIGSFSAPISTGCSFYGDTNTAVIKGVCEVIERHSVMSWWYLNYQNSSIIDLSSIFHFDITERIKRIKEKGLEVYLFEVSQFKGFPVIFCLVKSDSFPYACFGASCDLNIEKAIIKALDEAISIRIMSNFIGPNEGMDFSNFHWLQKLEDHMELYANWRDSPVISNLLERVQTSKDISDYSPSYSYNSQSLETIAVDFQTLGYDIYYKNITLPEVKPLGTVVKVVIPQMIPLSQSFNTRWLSTLLEKYSFEEINPYPQPFS